MPFVAERSRGVGSAGHSPVALAIARRAAVNLGKGSPANICSVPGLEQGRIPLALGSADWQDPSADVASW